VKTATARDLPVIYLEPRAIAVFLAARSPMFTSMTQPRTDSTLHCAHLPPLATAEHTPNYNTLMQYQDSVQHPQVPVSTIMTPQMCISMVPKHSSCACTYTGLFSTNSSALPGGRSHLLSLSGKKEMPDRCQHVYLQAASGCVPT